MLLLDVSAIIVGTVIEMCRQGEALTEHLVRSVSLSQILYYKKRYSKEYGKPILCIDARHYWRKELFPYYKQNRKKTRLKSKFDWDTFYELFNKVKAEFKDALPYYYMEVDLAEGDDIIAVLTLSADEPVMIVSADKDMLQLQDLVRNVKQFSTATKKLITIKSSGYSLVEHLIKGDSSDGIPNIFSDADTFVDDSKRQKAVKTTLVREAETLEQPYLICPDAISLDKFKRNRTLIDVNHIPEKYVNEILTLWEREKNTIQKDRLYSYFIKNGLRLFLNKIEEFR